MEAMNSLSLLFTSVFLFTYSNAASQVRFLKGFGMFLNAPYKKMPACQAVFLSAGTERKAEGNSESRLTFTKIFFQRHHDKTAQ